MASATSDALDWGTDTSASPCATIQPAADSPRILVIGGGVTGLITTWILLARGYRIAGALWEFPPAVCGSHTNETSLKRSNLWCMVVYKIWKRIAEEVGPLSGVRMRKTCFFFPQPVQSDAQQHNKMLEIAGSGVDSFRHSASILEEHVIDPAYGAVDAYEHFAPVIDTDVAMLWLMGVVRSKGAAFETRNFTIDLLEIEDELLANHDASAIVNCTGLSSLTLAGDETVYPLRGALLRLRNDNTRFPRITSIMSISADAAEDGSIVFLVPRNDDVLVLGGIAQPNVYSVDLTLDSACIRDMRARSEKFLPYLRNAQLVEDYPLAQGLRPARRDNVRVEREPRQKEGKNSRIVHNYGHGGSGWSLSFGCAADVAVIVRDIVESEKMMGAGGNWETVEARS